MENACTVHSRVAAEYIQARNHHEEIKKFVGDVAGQLQTMVDKVVEDMWRMTEEAGSRAQERYHTLENVGDGLQALFGNNFPGLSHPSSPAPLPMSA